MTERNIHGTCIAIDGDGVLLRGPSGVGKSDLALRLLDDGSHGEVGLVADDRVDIELRDGAAWGRAPESLKGRLEVRGIGLVAVAAVDSAPVRLVVDLVEPEDVPRLPDPASEDIAGVAVPRVALSARDPSAPAKVRIALAAFRDGGFPDDDGRVL